MTVPSEAVLLVVHVTGLAFGFWFGWDFKRDELLRKAKKLKLVDEGVVVDVRHQLWVDGERVGTATQSYIEDLWTEAARRRDHEGEALPPGGAA